MAARVARQREALEAAPARPPGGALEHIAAILATRSSNVPAVAEELSAPGSGAGLSATANLTRIAPACIRRPSPTSWSPACASIAADSPIRDLDLQVTRVVP